VDVRFKTASTTRHCSTMRPVETVERCRALGYEVKLETTPTTLPGRTAQERTIAWSDRLAQPDSRSQNAIKSVSQ